MITTIIAIVSLVVSVFTLLFFDIRIKKQEKILNEFKIKEYEAAEQEKKLAHLSMNKYWRDKDTLFLIIANDGPSDAYNISIKDLDKDSFLFQNTESTFPIKLIDAGDSVQIELNVYSDMPEKTRVQITWEDDSKKKHMDKVVIPIH